MQAFLDSNGEISSYEMFGPDALAEMKKAFKAVIADHPYLPPHDVAMRIMAAARVGVLDAETLAQLAARED